jgi:hypothetical protein
VSQPAGEAEIKAGRIVAAVGEEAGKRQELRERAGVDQAERGDQEADQPEPIALHGLSLAAESRLVLELAVRGRHRPVAQDRPERDRLAARDPARAVGRDLLRHVGRGRVRHVALRQ